MTDEEFAVPFEQGPIDVDAEPIRADVRDRMRRAVATTQPGNRRSLVASQSSLPMQQSSVALRRMAVVENRAVRIKHIATVTEIARGEIEAELTERLFENLRALAEQEEKLADLDDDCLRAWAQMKSNHFTRAMNTIELANREIDELAETMFRSLAEEDDFFSEPWTKTDAFLTGFSLNEHRLRRRGIPFTGKDVIKNFLTMGYHFDQLERNYDAQRRAQQQARRDEEVIDV